MANDKLRWARGRFPQRVCSYFSGSFDGSAERLRYAVFADVAS